jgi:outer membrane protein assembly factor BamB
VGGLGAISDSPTIAGSRVVVGTLTGRVDAFDLGSGHRLWSWRSPGDRPAIWSSPTVWRGRVLIGIASQYGDTPLEAGRLTALDLASGRLLWDVCVRPSCQAGGGIWSSPAVDRAGHAYVGTGNPDDGVLAVDGATGRRLWETSLHPDRDRDLDVGATPVILSGGAAERIAVGSTAGDFDLLDAADGSIVWSRNLVRGSPVHGLIGSPASDGRLLYVPSASPPTGVLAVAPADGDVRWLRSSAEPVYSSPAVGRGVLAVGTGAVFGRTSAGRVLVVAIDDGRVLWSFDARAAVWSSPAIAGDAVCLGDHAGVLRCFWPV